MSASKESAFRFAGTREIKPTQSYVLPDNRRLTSLVNRIEAYGTSGFIKPDELTLLAERLDANAALKNLPKDISREDFEGVLMLSMLTECATATYAAQFESASRKFNEPWLGHFTQNVWVPDEVMHSVPFKKMLMQLGYSERDLDREIADAQEKDYIHKAGDTPVHVTTYGMIQEYLTRHWYELIRGVLRPTSPAAAKMVARVEGREALHTVWYRDMTALQVEENPHLIGSVAQTLQLFEMPGNTIAPELQAKAQDWLPRMGGDLEKIKRDVVKLVHQIMGNTENDGRLVVEIAAQQGRKIGPFNAGQVRNALNKFGSPGYGLIGEALLQSVGLQGPYIDNEDGPVDKIRGVVRGFIAKQIDIDFTPPPAKLNENQ